MRLKTTISSSVAVWAICCGFHYYLYTLAILQGPHDDDAYAYSWSFQALAFAIVRLPFWILGLLAIVAGEYLYHCRINTTKGSEPSDTPNPQSPSAQESDGR